MIAAAPALPRPGVAKALRGAVRDLYENSLRLVALGTLFSTSVVAILLASLWVLPALLLLPLTGVLAVALTGAAVAIVDEGDAKLADAADAVRAGWRRGLALVALVLFAAVVTATAVGFYGSRGALAWPLAVLALYLAGIFALLQLHLWPLAVRQASRPLSEVVKAAASDLVRRPAATVGLGLALLAINLVGLVAGILPFLTLTVPYSFLAAARFARPPHVEG
jgi:hypothetical protein